MTTATQTIFFTDLAGYTERVARSDREGLRRLLREHEGHVRPLVEAHGGRVVKNIGDSFLCLFPAATDALRAALAVQHQRRGRDPLHLRIALTTGDVEIIEGDAFGDAVNLAARILAETPPGEIWFTEATRQCSNRAEVPWEPVATLQLKGVPDPCACYRAVPEDRVWLPAAVVDAQRQHRLVVVAPNRPLPPLPADPLVLLQGFKPGDGRLEKTLGALPYLQPAAIFLAADRLTDGERATWRQTGRGLVVGTPPAIAFALQEVRERGGGERVNDETQASLLAPPSPKSVLEVVVCGLALPSVPLADVVAAYHFDLEADGHWSTGSERALLQVAVTLRGVTLEASASGVSVAGETVPPGRWRALNGRAVINTPVGAFEYLPLTGGYRGVILRDTTRRERLPRGGTLEVGRHPPSPGLALPVCTDASNLRWCAGEAASRARAGAFTLDRGLVGRRQFSLRCESGRPLLSLLHERCPTWRIKEGRLLRLRRSVALHWGDLLVAGTVVLAVRKP